MQTRSGTAPCGEPSHPSRALLRRPRRPRSSARPADHGRRRPAADVAGRLLRAAGQTGISGDPLRSPRHRLVDEDGGPPRGRLGVPAGGALRGGPVAARCRTRWSISPTTPRPCSTICRSIAGHVVGASMGGMIAQVLAANHPDRVQSLGIIMSSSGKALSALPRWRVIKLAFGGPGTDAPWEDRLASEVRNISIINGPNFLPPVDQLRRRVEDLRARSDYPQGMLRQFDAILGTGSLLRYTRAISGAHGRHPRLGGPDGATAQRPRPGPRHRGRPLSSSSTAWATICPRRCGGPSSRR